MLGLIKGSLVAQSLEILALLVNKDKAASRLLSPVVESALKKLDDGINSGSQRCILYRSREGKKKFIEPQQIATASRPRGTLGILIKLRV